MSATQTSAGRASAPARSAQHNSAGDLQPAARRSSADWRRAIERRGATVQAHGRLAEALHSLALDIGGYSDDLSTDERAWLLEAVRGPVDDAVRAALATLTRELARRLDRAPDRVRPAIVILPRVSRIDFE